jgi:hypothetical protein
LLGCARVRAIVRPISRVETGALYEIGAGALVVL